jgi:signal transduction histidine kinase
VTRLSAVRPDGSAIASRDWPALLALQGEAVPDHVLGLDRDGRRQWLSLRATPTPDGGAVLSFVDITPLHALEQQHEQMVRAVSHDIRNRLTSVHLNAQLLERSVIQRGLEKEQRFASILVGAARRLDTMIQELVDSARLRHGRLRLDLQPLEIARFVPDVLSRNTRMLDTNRVRLLMPQSSMTASADAARLERVLVSLLGNALKRGGDTGEAELHVRPEGDQIRFSVSDQGPTIAAHEVPTELEALLTCQPAGSEPGFGLGLFVASKLIEHHGGRLWLDSSAGAGATFHFTIPVSGPLAQRMQQAQARGSTGD